MPCGDVLPIRRGDVVRCVPPVRGGECLFGIRLVRMHCIRRHSLEHLHRDSQRDHQRGELLVKFWRAHALQQLLSERRPQQADVAEQHV